MNTEVIRREKITKAYAAIITLMVFATTAGLIWYHDAMSEWMESANAEKIKNESLLSEKLSLEKSIADMMGELNVMKGQNASVTKKWKDAVAAQKGSESKIDQMSNENAKAKKLIKEVEGLRSIKAEMTTEMERLKSDYANAMAENLKLNQQVAMLKDENIELTSMIASLNQVAVNNSLVEATKGKKERLTVAARKTKKLKVGFDIPEEMVGNLYFKMITPSGDQVSSNESTISFYESEINSELIASSDNVITETVKKKHIDMVYKPEAKLQSGIYKIDVYSGKNYLGTSRVHLK
ncbi:MAG: hypothetical protein R2813_04695 [Flavobacteriales bacterium]